MILFCMEWFCLFILFKNIFFNFWSVWFDQVVYQVSTSLLCLKLVKKFSAVGGGVCGIESKDEQYVLYCIKIPYHCLIFQNAKIIKPKQIPPPNLKIIIRQVLVFYSRNDQYKTIQTETYYIYEMNFQISFTIYTLSISIIKIYNKYVKHLLERMEINKNHWQCIGIGIVLVLHICSA